MNRRAGQGSGKLIKIALVLFVLGLAYVAFRFGPDARTAYRQGFLDSTRMREFSGDAIDNLRAQSTALLLYHDSEGQFPPANGWMDAIEPRLRTADMKAEEAAKKLRDPRLVDPKAYGFSMNAKIAGKYRDDIGGERTVLIFASKSTQRNASGDPFKDARAGAPLAITLNGTVVGIPSGGKP